jgi:hypothetical protein
MAPRTPIRIIPKPVQVVTCSRREQKFAECCLECLRSLASLLINRVHGNAFYPPAKTRLDAAGDATGAKHRT